jgi:hypothetical protein
MKFVMVLETHSRAVVRKRLRKTSGPALSGHQQLPCTMQDNLSPAVEGQPSSRNGSLSKSRSILSARELWGWTLGGVQFTGMWCCVVRRGSLQRLRSSCANRTVYFWFQTFALFWMSYSFFRVIHRRLNIICRRFGTLCSILIGGVSRKTLHRRWRWNWQIVPKRRRITFRRRGVTQKEEYTIVYCHNTVEAGKIQPEEFVRVVRS